MRTSDANAVHHTLDQVQALLKCVRLAQSCGAFEDATPMDRWDVQQVLLVIERTLAEGQQALQEVLPYQDMLAQLRPPA